MWYSRKPQMVKCWLCPHCNQVYVPCSFDGESGRCPKCGCYESSARNIQIFDEEDIAKMKIIHSDSNMHMGYQKIL